MLIFVPCVASVLCSYHQAVLCGAAGGLELVDVSCIFHPQEAGCPGPSFDRICESNFDWSRIHSCAARNNCTLFPSQAACETVVSRLGYIPCAGANVQQWCVPLARHEAERSAVVMCDCELNSASTSTQIIHQLGVALSRLDYKLILACTLDEPSSVRTRLGLNSSDVIICLSEINEGGVLARLHRQNSDNSLFNNGVTIEADLAGRWAAVGYALADVLAPGAVCAARLEQQRTQPLTWETFQRAVLSRCRSCHFVTTENDAAYPCKVDVVLMRVDHNSQSWDLALTSNRTSRANRVETSNWLADGFQDALSRNSNEVDISGSILIPSQPFSVESRATALRPPISPKGSAYDWGRALVNYQSAAWVSNDQSGSIIIMLPSDLQQVTLFLLASMASLVVVPDVSDGLPPPALRTETTVAPSLHGVVVSMGRSGTIPIQFTHELSLADPLRPRWNRLALNGLPPPALYRHAVVSLSQYIFIIGGFAQSTTSHRAFYTFDRLQNRWEARDLSAALPQGRCAASGVLSSGRRWQGSAVSESAFILCGPQLFVVIVSGSPQLLPLSRHPSSPTIPHLFLFSAGIHDYLVVFSLNEPTGNITTFSTQHFTWVSTTESSLAKADEVNHVVYAVSRGRELALLFSPRSVEEIAVLTEFAVGAQCRPESRERRAASGSCDSCSVNFDVTDSGTQCAPCGHLPDEGTRYCSPRLRSGWVGGITVVVVFLGGVLALIVALIVRTRLAMRRAKWSLAVGIDVTRELSVLNFRTKLPPPTERTPLHAALARIKQLNKAFHAFLPSWLARELTTNGDDSRRVDDTASFRVLRRQSDVKDHLYDPWILPRTSGKVLESIVACLVVALPRSTFDRLRSPGEFLSYNKLLGLFLDGVAAIVSSHNGVVDVFAGDRCFATFNASHRCTGAVLNATETALALKIHLIERLPKEVGPISCGISQGVVKHGILGRLFAKHSMVLGPIVAEAASLCRVAPSFKSAILLPWSLNDEVRFDVILRIVGSVDRGAALKVVAEVMSRRRRRQGVTFNEEDRPPPPGALEPPPQDAIDAHNEILEAAAMGDLTKARELRKELEKQYPPLRSSSHMDTILAEGLPTVPDPY